jgi:hypothetical protein
MKKILLLGICMAFVACQQKKEAVVAQEMPFFVFDAVDYYHLDIKQQAVDSIAMKADKTNKELALMQILQQRIPVSTIDTLFINNMEILSFDKMRLDSKMYKELGQLFVKQTVENPSYPSCEPIYRDVLIFRKKDKVIGVAKLDFDCGRSAIVGARYDASLFGQSGEYVKLQHLLRSLKTAL